MQFKKSQILISAALVVELHWAQAFMLVAQPCSNQHRGVVRSFHQSVATDQEVEQSPIFIDEMKLLAERPGTTKSPEEMVLIAKKFLVSSNGIGGDASLLANDFVFAGPVVGPLSKDAFVAAIGNVDFAKAFPAWKGEFYGFHVDPFDGDRVWYMARGRGTNTGPLPPFISEENGTGLTVENPPQVCSLTVDQTTGLIRKYTIGYVVDRSIGNTGGLGGLYGILYALGRPLPFPEAKPWKMSLRYRFFQNAGNLISKLSSSSSK